MFVYEFTPLTELTILVSLASVIAIYTVLLSARYLDSKGHPNWRSRKTIHIGIGTIIGLTLVVYQSFTGPVLTIGLFFLPLIIGRVVGKPGEELLDLARRKEGNRISAFAAGVSAVSAYALIFVFLPTRPDIFVSAILAVSWGDGAGEMIGRPFGVHTYSISGNERSLEGSGAVAIFSLVAFCVSTVLFSTIELVYTFPILIIAALAVVLVEAVSPLWSDNFFIPICTAVILFFLTSL